MALGAIGGFMAGLGGGIQASRDRKQREQEGARADRLLALYERDGLHPQPALGAVSMGGGSGGRQRAGGDANARYGIPADPVAAARIRDGLVQRGMPAHIAEGFVWNMQDESGLNPGINERQPLVEGSRGGFGLYQLTGPRRRQFEAFASERGVSPADYNAQLDFLMHELETTERSARDAIFAAPDANQAAVAIVERFLRPAEEHRNRRAAAYASMRPQAPLAAVTNLGAMPGAIRARGAR